MSAQNCSLNQWKKGNKNYLLFKRNLFKKKRKHKHWIWHLTPFNGLLFLLNLHFALSIAKWTSVLKMGECVCLQHSHSFIFAMLTFEEEIQQNLILQKQNFRVELLLNFFYFIQMQLIFGSWNHFQGIRKVETKT